MPRTRHSQSQQVSRVEEISQKHLAGYIAWLPPFTTEGIDLSLDKGCYKHPVVILSPSVNQDRVSILTVRSFPWKPSVTWRGADKRNQLTSFGGVDLAARHRFREARKRYLPIAPSRPHPDNGILLHFKDSSLGLRKRTYIHTRVQHTIRFESLRPYRNSGNEYTLSRASYQQLIEYAHFVAPLPDPSQIAGPLAWSGSATAEISTSNYEARLARYQPEYRPLATRTRPLDTARMAHVAHAPWVGTQSSRSIRQSRRVDHLEHMWNPNLHIYSRNAGQAWSSSGRHNYGTISASSPTPRTEGQTSRPFWRVVWIVACLSVAAALGYGIYLGGCWTV